MQSNFESGSFNRPGLVLPFQRRAVEPWGSRKRATSGPPSALWLASGDVLKARRWEDLAWLGLALAALALVLESFF